MIILGMVWIFVLTGISGDVLVLKNGKTMLCDSFVVSEGRVVVQAKGQTFTLPESLIDWEASEKARAELTAQAQAEAKAAEEAVKEAHRPQAPREKITLTTKDLKKEDGDVATGPVTINFAMISNSIVVGMHINGKGPFNFILDTGASITTIDPEIVEKAGVTVQDRAISVVGVGGQPITAPLISIKTLALQGATVWDLEAVSTRIDHLYSTGLYGLIGQDFLNHFVMNLDATTKTLTLTPQNSRSSESSKIESALKYDPDFAVGELQQALFTMDRNYRLFVSGNSHDPAPMVRELKQARQQIQTVKQHLLYQNSFLNSTESVNLTAAQRAHFKDFQACLPRANLFIDNLLTLNRTLTSACNSQQPNARLLQDLARHMQKADQSLDEYMACYRQVGN